MRILNYLIILLIYFHLNISWAQNVSKLSIPEIMKGEDFVGYLPEDLSWSEDGKSVYFTWNPDRQILRNLYKVDIKGLKPELVTSEEQISLPTSRGDYSRDFNLKVYSKNGDIFLLDIKSGMVQQVTNTLKNEMNPVFTADEKNIIYRKENNLYSWAISNGSTRQLTNFTTGNSQRENKPSDQEEWLKKDQLEFFEILAERKEKKEKQEEKNKLLEPERPIEINVRGKQLIDLNLSPDQNYAVFRLSKVPDGYNGTKISDYVTESGYTNEINARPKVGSPERTYELGIYDLLKDTVYYVDPEKIPGIFDKPQFLKDYLPSDSTFNDQYDKPREVSYWGLVFNAKGDRTVIVIRSHDNKDRWIMLLNLFDGSMELLDRQRDEAWIGGPGIGMWNFGTGNIGWLGDDMTVWYQSEESGYSHIYTIHTKSKEKKQLTNGPWEVYESILSKDKKHFYIIANKEDPSERHFYRMRVNGDDLVKITQNPGNYEVKISPDEKMLALRYSYSNKPWELYFMPNRPGAQMLKVTHSTTTEFNQYSWREPELVSFQAEDGALVHARLYTPENPEFDGPAVIFVHGAGYLQNVHRWWSQYYHEYMFHNFLADNGYTVLDIDYRGSEGYGRDWRTGIYRHMGGKDLSDQVDGAKYLIKNHMISPNRIGIYGGSYGGFITIFAMFKYPEIFRCGAALRSVTDWAHYNHPYTSNILNTPLEDSIAYRRSSPIYYADGLEGELLLLHGMIDTNVHFQDVVRLSQKLIELGKDNWNLAVFPLEDHSFKESSSWADEYRRIFDLFERNLK